MKRQLLILFTAIIATAPCNAQNSKNSLLNDKTFTYADSSAFHDASISLTLPTSKSTTATNIRQHLLGKLYAYVSGCVGKDSILVEKIAKKRSKNYGAIVKEYTKLIGKSIGEGAKETAIYRYKWENDIEDSVEVSVPDSELTIWPFYEDLYISRLDDGTNSRYAVYDFTTRWYSGGAHGGIAGEGAITFDLKTGLPFSNFFQYGLTERVYDQMIEGLIRYFADECEVDTEEDLADYLLVTLRDLELPAAPPYPTKDGLVFTYSQYEIAPYAAGMPTFTMPYDKIKSNLTPEALELLGLEQ